ncbi:hypothetical protein DENSPDRAFT_413972 [Dentipellis sp. KUC8613]|nr:hypothetical protein DENSPDRAFT_413972 [Dentipellis sp. KUC8613]
MLIFRSILHATHRAPPAGAFRGAIVRYHLNGAQERRHAARCASATSSSAGMLHGSARRSPRGRFPSIFGRMNRVETTASGTTSLPPCNNELRPLARLDLGSKRAFGAFRVAGAAHMRTGFAQRIALPEYWGAVCPPAARRGADSCKIQARTCVQMRGSHAGRRATRCRQ